MVVREHPMKKPSKSSFRRLIEYLLDSQGKHERVENVLVENCIADNPLDAVEEIIATQKKNTRAKSDKTYHFSINFPVGEKPPEEEYKKMVEEYCAALGLQGHQRIIVAHNDTENFHLHVAVNKINPNTKRICSLHQSQATLNKTAERLEKEYGLSKTNHTPNKTRAENLADDMEHHSGLESFIGYLKRNCATQLETATTWAQVHKICAENGVALKNVGGGLVFESIKNTKIKAKASSVSRKLTRKRLEERLGKFQADFSTGNANKFYKKQPIGFKKNSGFLFVQYKQEINIKFQEFVGEKKEERKKRKKEYGETISNAVVYLKTLNDITKNQKSNFAMEMLKLYYILCMYEARHKQLEMNLEMRQRKFTKPTFVGWLQQKATQGDKNALNLLRSREKAGLAKEKNVIISKKIAVQLNNQRGSARHISKKGMFVYKNVRTDGENIKIKDGVNIEIVQEILKMAGNEPIAVKGNAEFISDIVKSSVITNTQFKDQRLEQFRKNHGNRITTGKYRCYSTSIGIARNGSNGNNHSASGGRTNGNESRKYGFNRKNGITSNIFADKKSYTQRIFQANTLKKAPPPNKRNVLRKLSECPMVCFPNERAMLLHNDVPNHMEFHRARQRDNLRWSAIGQNTSQSKIDAAESYIENRQKNIEKGVSDILPHIPFLNNHSYIYQGIRNKNNEKLALLKFDEKVEVLPIDEELGIQFAAFKVGDPIKILNQNGKITIENQKNNDQDQKQLVKLSNKELLAKAMQTYDKNQIKQNKTEAFKRSRQ